MVVKDCEIELVNEGDKYPPTHLFQSSHKRCPSVITHGQMHQLLLSLTRLTLALYLLLLFEGTYGFP